MSHLGMLSDSLFHWLVQTSWHVAILVVLVLLLQTLLARWLRPRWTYVLWLVVVLRLAIPVVPESAVGLFRWDLPDWSSESTASDSATFQPPPAVLPPRSDPPAASGKDRPPRVALTRHSTFRSDLNVLAPVTVVEEGGRGFPITNLVVAIWLVITAFLLMRIVVVEWRFRRRLRRAIQVEQPAILELLEECRKVMGVRGRVAVLETDIIRSPALMGLRRPRLLLPCRLLSDLSRSELRLIFLHELAHLRRRDVALIGVVACLQNLFWFHPLVHVAVARLRAALEAVRDLDALDAARSTQPTAYASTLLKLLDRNEGRLDSASAVSLFEGSREVKRRILMIANFDRMSHGGRLLGVTLLGVLSWVTFVSASAPEVLTPPLIGDGAGGGSSDLLKIVVERHMEPEQWRTELEEKLARKIDVVFEGVLIPHALEWLRVAADINIVTMPDVDALESGLVISLRIDQTDARSVLGLICEMSDSLDYCLTNGAVVVGERYKLPRSVDVRFYKIGPLLEQRDGGEPRFHVEDIIAGVVEFSGHPESWQEELVFIEYWNGLLLVSQYDEVHTSVLEFLELILNRGRVAPREVAEAESAIRKALQARVSIDFEAEPIGSALRQLETLVGVPMLAADELCDETIDLKLLDVTCASVLEWIAGLNGVYVSIKGNAVVLSDRPGVELVVYETGDIVANDQADSGADVLVDLIRQNIDPYSWDEHPEFMISWCGDLMLVTQSPQAHVEIDLFLAAMRRALDR